MESLPDEIQLHILSFGTVQEIINYSLTCVQFSRFLKDLPLWSQLVKSEYNYDPIKFSNQIITEQLFEWPWQLYKKIRHEFIEDSKYSKICLYVFTRGINRGQRCGSKSEPKSNFCKYCLRKKNVILRRDFNN